MSIKGIYVLFIGVLMAAFVGVGIAAFYVGPTFPEPPAILKYCSPDIAKEKQTFLEFKAAAELHDRQVKDYEAVSKVYNRNVSIASLFAAIIVLIVSLTYAKKIALIADGLLLGGVLTLVYSIIRGFGTDDNKFRFLVVTVGLIISLLLGYIKFIKTIPEKKPLKRQKK